jgi:signal transduction histidine kinase
VNADDHAETACAAVVTVLQQSGRLSRLVNELLDTSRIEAGQFEQHLEPADLAAVVRTAVEEQRQTALERTILLHVPVGEVVPVSAHVERIGQVVTNYLTNALRYSADVPPVEVGVQRRERIGIKLR